MTTNEQIRFVRELCKTVADEVVVSLRDKAVPDTWDGHELRMLLADRFERSASMSIIKREPRSARARAYRNEMLTGV